MSYSVVVSDDARDFLRALDVKSKRVCKKNLGKLSCPYPGRGSGDKERLVVDGKEMYRLHIGRTYTAFYSIDEGDKMVRVLEVLSIKAAHKKYGF
ncbi:MAG: type II toxin-antitoxin system RelE/ParE family toxin [Candidatus Woesearchaeota archaeon]|nr:type II toxin-antitoxin system RelE/ParE family toxin [Candidatus Woesearchaeota archaeon]